MSNDICGSVQRTLLSAGDETGPKAQQKSDVAHTSEAKLRVLLLCDFGVMRIGTVRDHVESLKTGSRHAVMSLDCRVAGQINLDLSHFDVIVLHYSLVIISDSYLAPRLREKIRVFPGYKVLFIQDEYRWVDATAAMIAYLGIDVLYTVANADAAERIYHHEAIRHVRRKTTLTGFVPETLTRMNVPSYVERRIDVGYRARRVPMWLGAFAQEKWQIGVRFQQDAQAYGLTCDIAWDENRRLYGNSWVRFVASCRAMLGTESGASFVDFSGNVQPVVEAMELADPEVSFEQVNERFFEGRDGEIVIHVISPRCFEAAALRTLMILYPGTYSGALVPWRHYVPLARDHGNMEEVVGVLRDRDRAGTMIDAAYREVALNERYWYQSLVSEFDADLEAFASAKLARDGVLPACRADASEAVREIERKLNSSARRAAWYLKRTKFQHDLVNAIWQPVRRTKHATYVAVHRMIDLLVPVRWKADVRRCLKQLAARISDGR